MVQADLYRKYFQHQCVEHPLLAEGEDGKVFETVSVEEALGDLRSKVQEKGFIFRLIDYTYQVQGNGAGDNQKIVNGGFLVAKHFSTRTIGKQSLYDARDQSEKVVDTIIEKMIGDSIDGHPLFYHSLNTAENIFVQPVENVGDNGYAGWICTFYFNNHFRICPENPITAWGDGGTTPHEL